MLLTVCLYHSTSNITSLIKHIIKPYVKPYIYGIYGAFIKIINVVYNNSNFKSWYNITINDTTIFLCRL